MAEITPTRGAALALAEERNLVETGFGFLDEKRMLLAATLLEELDAWNQLKGAYTAQMENAVSHLQNTFARHGQQSVQLYPSPRNDTQTLTLKSRNFLGLGLLEDPELEWQPPAPQAAVDPSQQVEDCRGAFARLLPLGAKLAARAQNIHTLMAEYRKTERRARALENVILPETIANLTAITEYLDESDQEEAIRIRSAAP